MLFKMGLKISKCTCDLSPANEKCDEDKPNVQLLEMRESPVFGMTKSYRVIPLLATTILSWIHFSPIMTL